MSSEEYKKLFPGHKLFLFTKEQCAKRSKTNSVKDEFKKRKQFFEDREAAAQEMRDMGLDPIICEVCGFESMFSIISHIRHKHDISISDYREKYPNSLLQRNSPKQSRKASEAMKQRLSDIELRQKFLDWRSFPSEIKHWTRKGFSEEDAALKVSEFQREQGLKFVTPENILKLKQMFSGSNGTMSLESIARRNGVSIAEARYLTPCYGRCGDLHPMFGKHHTQEALLKIASAPHLKTPSSRSKGEIELFNACCLIGECDHNSQLGRWNVDVLFRHQKLIVEYFGDYWHMSSKLYLPNDIHNITNIPACVAWRRDAYKLSCLNELGYFVLIVWESDWNINKDLEIKRIKDASDRLR